MQRWVYVLLFVVFGIGVPVYFAWDMIKTVIGARRAAEEEKEKEEVGDEPDLG